jgi:hypothetical protein
MNKFILEKREFYKKGDKVNIEYWYRDLITPVEILEVIGRKFKISHNIPESEIQNAPDQLIKRKDILDRV